MKSLTRRQILKAAGSAAALGAVGLPTYAFGIEPHWVAIERRAMPVRGLPEALEGATLVHITDLHVGPIVDSDFLRRALRVVSDLAPDIVCITGDFMSYRGDWCIDEVARVMESLAPPPLGTFAVLGNHDYGRAWKEGDVADRLVAKLTDAGVRVLRNEAVDVKGLRLVGVDDYWGTNFDPVAAMRDHRADVPSVVLCHNPDAADGNFWFGFDGWTLCGHTHGGQCKPPFLPAPLLPVKNRRYTRGEIALDDGRRLYINPGLGYLRRVRFNVRPEITVFRMERDVA